MLKIKLYAEIADSTRWFWRQNLSNKVLDTSGQTISPTLRGVMVQQKQLYLLKLVVSLKSNLHTSIHHFNVQLLFPSCNLIYE